MYLCACTHHFTTNVKLIVSVPLCFKTWTWKWPIGKAETRSLTKHRKTDVFTVKTKNLLFFYTRLKLNNRKLKLTQPKPCRNMGGSTGTRLAQHILNFRIWLRWESNITPRPFYPPAKNLGTHWTEGLVESKPVWTSWGREKSPAPVRIWESRAPRP